LSEDENSYVRKAAERSLDRRRKGQQTSSRRRIVLGSVADDYEMMERLHGTLATKKSRQIAERLYDVLVGATIHNMRGMLTPVSGSAHPRHPDAQACVRFALPLRNSERDAASEIVPLSAAFADDMTGTRSTDKSRKVKVTNV
jgi:hypothetical protein